MKMIAGVVLAGAVAAGVAVVAPKVGGGPEPLAAEAPGEKPKGKFATPVWHPDARWERDPEPWAAVGMPGDFLDGPRREIMWRRGFSPWGDYRLFMPGGGPYSICMYDGKSERIHAVTCGARGHLDGPFSRARYAGHGYGSIIQHADSLDRRYHFFLEPHNGYCMRVLDLKEQTVRTLLPPGSGAQAMTADSKGRILILLKEGRLVTIDPDTMKREETTLKATEGLRLGRWGPAIALDEARGRLYASGIIIGRKWHVWYFDLKAGGTFHGVLSGGKTGPGGGYAGPFDGYKGYGEGSIRFGPDDPGKRFLYMRITDTGTFLRLDLEKRMVAACSGPPRNKSGPVMFINEGRPGRTSSHVGPGWLPDGGFVMPGVRERPAMLYRRVK